MLSATDTDPGVRGWLLFRRAKLLRGAQPRTALDILDTAAALAVDAGMRCSRHMCWSTAGRSAARSARYGRGWPTWRRASPNSRACAPADVAAAGGTGAPAGRPEPHRCRRPCWPRCWRWWAASARHSTRRTPSLRTRMAHRCSPGGRARSRWRSRAEQRGQRQPSRSALLSCNVCPHMSPVPSLLLQQLSLRPAPLRRRRPGRTATDRREGEAPGASSGGAHGDDLPAHRLAADPADRRGLGGGARTGAERRPVSGRDLGETSDVHHRPGAVGRAQGDVSLAWEHVNARLPGGPQTLPGTSISRRA